jgi:muramidase (phage lysozyme)
MRVSWPVLVGLAAALMLASLRRALAYSGGFVGPMPEPSPGGGAGADDAGQARANRRAFLQMLRYAEGTADANGYRAVYGHTAAAPRLFGSFTGHPVETGEWKGAPLSDTQCRGAGLGPGCITTAAGAYQMTLPTWTRMRQALSLTDFSPASQDQAALRLIADLGALADVDAGRIDTAVEKLRRTWASLPGAGYAGQPERSIASLRSVYSAAGGAIA